MNGLTKKLQSKLKTTWKLMKMINHSPKSLGHSKSSHKRKYIAIRAFLKKDEGSQIHNLILHLEELEKKQQIKTKTSIRQEIIKIRAEVNAIETKTIVEQINKARNRFFEGINKTDKPLANLIKEKGKNPNK